jgi:multiple sugar transport system permease protein
MSLAQTLGISKGSVRKRPRVSRGEISGWLGSLPLIIVILVLFGYPVVNAMRMSVTTADGTWIGLVRYGNVLQDRQWSQSVEFTVLFTVGSVGLHLVLGLAMALMLTHRKRSPRVLNIFRGLLILPWVISLTVAAPMIKLLFHQLGVVNYVLTDGLHIINQPIPWMGDPHITPWFIIAISGWQVFPFFMILFIGAIQAIPGERYEAARIDGAGAWPSFLNITLPGITGTALRLVVLDAIWMWRSFEIAYLLTGGGPLGKTTTLSFLTYTLAFQGTNLNYAATVAMLMSVVSMVVTLILLRIPEPEVAD